MSAVVFDLGQLFLARSRPDAFVDDQSGHVAVARTRGGAILLEEAARLLRPHPVRGLPA